MAVIPKIATFALTLGLAIGLPTAAEAAVQPGDKLNIIVFNHPELSVQTTVDASGKVSLPVAGLVEASYAEPNVVAERVRERLTPFVPNVAVDVQVLAQSTSLFISGGPGGVLTYAPGETLTDAVQTALVVNRATTSTGVPLTVSATNIDPFRSPVDLHNVRVLRNGSLFGTYDVQALLEHGTTGIAMQPGDTIGLAYKPVAVTVTGQVMDAGIAHLWPTEPLSNALLQVGGVNATTAGFAIILNRGGQQQIVTTTSAAYSEPAHDGDVLTVPPAIHVAVTGDVNKPGNVALLGDPSLLSALYLAGGPNAVGDLANVKIVHQGQTTSYDVTKVTHGEPGAVASLADGDTVYVPASPHHVDYRGIFNSILQVGIASLYLIPRP
jgi:protein involved in polysaccharide export with SLBB domain